MYLGYVDDSGTTNEKDRFGIYAAVLIPADDFLKVEFLAGLSVLLLIPGALHEGFEEFHARDLFHGYGIFKDISEKDRFNTIEIILNALLKFSDRVAIIYGAVNKQELARGSYATASPVDIAFRECLDGIEVWLRLKDNEQTPDEDKPSCLLIVDEVSNGTGGKQPIKDQLKRTFLDKRKRAWRAGGEIDRINGGELQHIHDDLYFGDSRYSIGIQMADLCAYFIGLHLAGVEAAEPFFDIFKDSIKVDRIKP